MKKIQLAIIVNDLNINGISTVIMNYCTNMDLGKFDITIIAGAPINNEYKKMCELLGISIIELPPRKTNSKQYYITLWKKLVGNFDIVHVHGNSATIAIELLIAFLRGIKVRIAHCHSTSCNNLKVHKMLLPLFKHLYTEGFACSKLAGEWLFGNKKFYVIPNGFDTIHFQFNQENRDKLREELHIEESYVIGHIGRFNDPKNHPFLLKVFEQVAAQNSKAYLLLIGDGPDYDKIMQLIDEHPYKERIIAYGETAETEKMYAAMDVFVFPSKQEGLGIVLLEAQISGLPCLASDVVPKEVILGDNIRFLSLDESATVWAETIQSMKLGNRELFYDTHSKQIRKYNISDGAEYLTELYKSFLKI